MQLDPITTSNTANVQHATTRGFNDLKGEDFFALMIAQLQAQDPMKPTDNQQLLNQISSIRQMEQSSALNSTLASLAAEQQYGSTSALIGHYIAGTVKDSAGQPHEIQGLVIGVRYEGGKGILELHNGNAIPAENVEQVTLVENLPPDLLAQLQHELEQLGIGGAAGGTSGGTTDPPATNGSGSSSGGKNIFPSLKSKMQWTLDPATAAGNAQKTKRASLIEALMKPHFATTPDVDDE